MARYQYRALEVFQWVKEPEDAEKRRGRKPCRACSVRDLSTDEQTDIVCEIGQHAAFTARVAREFITYLDALGNEGWQIISYTTKMVHDGRMGPWPEGTYMLMREAL